MMVPYQQALIMVTFLCSMTMNCVESTLHCHPYALPWHKNAQTVLAPESRKYIDLQAQSRGTHKYKMRGG